MNFVFSLLLVCILLTPDNPHGGLLEGGACLSEIILKVGLIRGGLFEGGGFNRITTVNVLSECLHLTAGHSR